MEVNLKLNSSLLVGAAAGVALSVALSGHCSKWTRQVGSLLCPHELAKKLGLDSGKTSKVQKSCCGGSKPSAPSSSSSASEDEGKGGEERAEEREAFWFTEGLTEVFRVSIAMKNILFDARSDFQRVQVIETEQFGRTLVMDGQTQSAKADEHIYHESLVHPAVLLHPNPKAVFIGGGGEFATAREVLRHKSVERCVMVDIDQVACDICREQLPEWNDGAYDDPRFHVEYTDAKAWLEETDEKFDVIIMDICDPIEAGPGYKLYTNEFYTFLRERLTPGGVFVTQSGPCAVYNAKEECFTVIHNTLQSAFDVVVPYCVDVPSFGCNWGFNLAFNLTEEGADANKGYLDVINHDIDAFNQKIEERIRNGSGALRFLDGVSFRGLVGIPKEIRVSCQEEDRVMTIDNPVFMYSG